VSSASAVPLGSPDSNPVETDASPCEAAKVGTPLVYNALMDTAADEIATVRIELTDSEPPIWREVEVATSISLKTLHAVIQAAFGWQNYHLWEFSLGKRRYGPPSGDDWGEEPLVDASKVRLADLLGPRRTKIDYLYDFGDSWEHRLTVSNVRAGDPDRSYPRYVGGERNGPPEDCGGIPGFYDKLDAAADPDHPDHTEIKEWLGDYDAETIDEAPIKYALGRIANQRRAGKGRPREKKSA
jgi:pRiA4b ORF-3-like protein